MLGQLADGSVFPVTLAQNDQWKGGSSSPALSVKLTRSGAREKSGLETILDLKDEFPQIIAMTGWDAKNGIDVLAITQEWGSDGLLSKPFKAEEVTSKIRALLG